MDEYPYTAEDMFELRVANMTDFSRSVHMNCFDSCAQRQDVPLLTVGEGLCFRNCITKFSTWLPTVEGNLQNAAFHYYNRKAEEIRGSKGNALYEDPWEVEREMKLIQLNRQQ